MDPRGTLQTLLFFLILRETRRKIRLSFPTLFFEKKSLEEKKIFKQGDQTRGSFPRQIRKSCATDYMA